MHRCGLHMHLPAERGVPKSTGPDRFSDIQPLCLSQNLSFPPLPHGSMNICHGLCSSVLPLSTTMTARSLLPHAPTHGHRSHLQRSPPSPSLLRNALPSILTKHDSHNRCLTQCTGEHNMEEPDTRNLARSRNQDMHQHAGT